MLKIKKELSKDQIISVVGAITPVLFFGLWWMMTAPLGYWFFKRILRLLPTKTSIIQARAREAEGLLLLSALSGSLKAGLPLLPALSNVSGLLGSSLKSDVERIYSLLLLGADPKQAWVPLKNDFQLGLFARSMAQAQVEGRSLAIVIERAVQESFEKSMALSKERVKSLSVKLALPVGLCFLPSFLIGGIGPVIYSFFTSLKIF
jgi:Flp pilus assembly protein TadB